MKISRITKRMIVKDLQSHWKNAQCEIGKTALGKGVIHVTGCWHGDCERIGQYVFRTYPKQIFTYFACHEFKKGSVSIYFKH